MGPHKGHPVWSPFNYENTGSNVLPLINPQPTEFHQWFWFHSLLHKGPAGNHTGQSVTQGSHLSHFYFLSVWSSSSICPDSHHFNTIEDYRPAPWGHSLQLVYDISGSSTLAGLLPRKAGSHQESIMSTQLCLQWRPASHLATVTSARHCALKVPWATWHLKVSYGEVLWKCSYPVTHSLVCMNRGWGSLILFNGLSSCALNSQIVPFGQCGQLLCLSDMPSHCVSTASLSGLSWLFPAPGRWSISLNFFAEVGI